MIEQPSGCHRPAVGDPVAIGINAELVFAQEYLM